MAFPNDRASSKPCSRRLTRRQFVQHASLAALPLAAGCSAQNFFDQPVTAASASAVPPGPVSPFDSDLIRYQLNHYLITGQSLATGDHGFFGISQAQPFNNKMFGLPFDNTNAFTLNIPNVGISPLTAASDSRETIGDGFADTLTAQARAILANFPDGPATYDIFMSCSGISGYTYAQLCGPTDWNASNPYWAANGGGSIGSPPFQEMMSQVVCAMKYAKQMGLSYRVAGMVVVHGEFDSTNPEYPANLQTWQADMQNGVQALTGQTGVIPMIAAQTQSFLNTDTFALSGSFGTYLAATAVPAKILLACPEYATMHHLAGETGPTAGYTIHMTADGYRHLGTMMAKAARVATMEGGTWSPLAPISCIRNGNQIVIRHHVPVLPLVLDTSWVTDPGHLGYSWVDANDATIAIRSVTLTAADTVTITLNQASLGGTIGYANFAPPSDPSYTSAGGGSTTDYGPTRGPRGCLRDSDTAMAYYKPTVPYYKPAASAENQYPMQNYCVMWQMAV